jgi:hypothetical protein
MDLHCQADDNANGFWKVYNLEQTLAAPKPEQSSASSAFRNFTAKLQL